MWRDRAVRQRGRGTVAGAASALDTQDNRTRKYSARHASKQAVLAIQVPPSEKNLQVVIAPSRLDADSWYFMNIDSTLLPEKDVHILRSLVRRPVVSLVSFVVRQSLHLVAPTAGESCGIYKPGTRYALSRAPCHPMILHTRHGPPSKYRNTPSTNHRA